MSIQEAHAGALAGALSMLPGGQEGAPGTTGVPATATFHPADPAIRLGPSIDLGGARGRPLSGAHVRIEAVRDGDAELLLYDLGGSRILPSIDYLPTHDVLDVHFVGAAPAEAYARLLSSLRYINRAPNPTAGERSIDISVMEADGAERPVGHLALTVATDRPAPLSDVAADEPAAVPVASSGHGARSADDGANPFALVVWNAADGGARPDEILGWHRAGEAPRRAQGPGGRHLAASRETPPEGVAASPDDVTADVPESHGTSPDGPGDASAPDRPVFGDEALHLYGAADLPLTWNGRGVAALSRSASRETPEDSRPVDYRGDGAADGARFEADEGYHIFGSGSLGTAGGAMRSWATPIDDPRIFQALRPVDVFQAGGGGRADTVSAVPDGAIPRLDAFLVGLPPSGDPLRSGDGEEAA